MPSLSHITPVILTFNEAANIARCLTQLGWARRIVIVDSGSVDNTRQIASSFSNVEVFCRPFDTHAAQWNYAIGDTGISTEWVLALDADYVIPASAVEWIAGFNVESAVGVSFPFRYAIHGRTLSSGIYPPVTTLYQRARAHYVQDGHTQRVVLDGRVAMSPIPFIHDDRKPLPHWFRAQIGYARLEAEKLRSTENGLKAWLRTRTPLSPLLVGLHCLVFRGGILEGPPGWLYALQRMVAEGLIAIEYCTLTLQREDKH